MKRRTAGWFREDVKVAAVVFSIGVAIGFVVWLFVDDPTPGFGIMLGAVGAFLIQVGLWYLFARIDGPDW